MLHEGSFAAHGLCKVCIQIITTAGLETEEKRRLSNKESPEWIRSAIGWQAGTLMPTVLHM